MSTTDNLALPMILPSQAQKHVTHNEAITLLDSLVQLTVTAHDIAAAGRAHARRALHRADRGERCMAGP